MARANGNIGRLVGLEVEDLLVASDPGLTLDPTLAPLPVNPLRLTYDHVPRHTCPDIPK